MYMQCYKKDLVLHARNFEVESCNNKAFFVTIPEHKNTYKQYTH